MTSMLLALPTDISLHILALLSLHDLRSLRLVSRDVEQFFLAHEESIYHQAAIYHRFVLPQTLLEDAVRAEGKWVADVRDWKELCRRWATLERNWGGRGYVHEGGYKPAADSVVNFAVDESQRTAIVLTRRGGLTVHALEDNRLLWAIGKDYFVVKRIELSQGFLVFIAKHSGLEIWRRASDIHEGSTISNHQRSVATPIQIPSACAVRDFQLQAASLAPRDTISNRGHFVPHAYIDTSNDIGAVRLFRINFPLLAYIGFNHSNTVTVVDVATGDTLWNTEIGAGRVRGMPSRFVFPAASDRVPMDLDLSKEHLCVCLYSVVVMFRLPQRRTSEDPRTMHESSRQDEGPPEMLVLSDMDVPAARRTNACQLTPSATWTQERREASFADKPLPVIASPLGRAAFERFEITPPSDASQRANMHALVPANGPRPQPGFVCARFSPDGRHVVATTAFGLVYFVWDFARVEGEEGAMFSDLLEYLVVDEPLRDVVWDVDLRRMAIRTAWEDVYIITLNESFHALWDASRAAHWNEGEERTRPSILTDASAMRLRDYSDRGLVGWSRGQGPAFNGMQMTHSALWLVWDVGLLTHAVGKRTGPCSGVDWPDPGGVGTGIGSLCFVDFTPGL